MVVSEWNVIDDDGLPMDKLEDVVWVFPDGSAVVSNTTALTSIQLVEALAWARVPGVNRDGTLVQIQRI